MPKPIEILVRFTDLATKPLTKLGTSFKKFGKGVKATFSQLANLPNIIAGFALFRIGKSFVEAAAQMQIFQRQLMMVTSTAEEATSALKQIREFARTSPLETEDVVQSYVRLRAVGLNPTIEQMKVMGGVAVLMNRQLTDVTGALISRHARTLREYGIELDATGKKVIVASDTVRKEVEKNNAAIREAILEVWAARFPDAITKAANTFKSRMAIMRSNIFEFQVQFMERFLPVLERFVDAIAGSFEKAQKNIQIFIKTALAVIAVVRTIWNTLTILTRGIFVAVTWIVQGFAGVYKILVRISNSILAIAGGIGRAFEAIKAGNFSAAGDEMLGALTDAKDQIMAIGGDVEKTLGNMVRFAGIANQQTGKDIQDIVNSWKTFASVTKATEEQIIGALASVGTFGAEGKAEEQTKKIIEKMDSHVQAWIKRQRELNEQILDSQDRLREARINAMEDDNLRALELMKLKHEQELRDFEDNEKAKKNILEAQLIERQALENKIAADKTKRDEDLNARTIKGFARLTDEMVNITAAGLDKEVEAAKKLQIVLAGIALIEGTASAAIALRKIWQQSSSWQEALVESVAVGAEILAVTAGLVASIKSASFGIGTKHAPGGLAMVHKDEMINLPRGSQVYTAAETRQIIGSKNTVSMPVNIYGSITREAIPSITRQLEEHGRKTVEAIRRGFINLSDLHIAQV